MKKKLPPDFQQALGARLESARSALGIRHIDMAKVAGLSPQAWNNYVSGIRPLSIPSASLLCERYGLTLDWIYRGKTGGLPHALVQRLEPGLSENVVPIKRR